MDVGPQDWSPAPRGAVWLALRILQLFGSRGRHMSSAIVACGMRSSVKSKYESYRKILEKKAEEVRNSMSAQKAAQVLAREEHPHDEGDLSQQSHEEWIFLNRNTLDIKLLREVQDALRRIEQGSYGVCYECDEPISAKRLDAVPWAKFCVSCQERVAARAESGNEEALQEADR